jgi:ribosome-associated translation inhibitor RaiA
MPENKNSAIQIGQLNMRIPGANAEAGRSLANGITQNLAQRISNDKQRHIGALNVRVQLPANGTEAEMSVAVAEAIIRALRK